MSEMFVYKIRRPDGQFSTGGERPTFTSKGKVWRARGHVTSHLKIARGYPEGTEVVRFRVVEEADEVVGIRDWEESPSTTRARELEEARRLEREQAHLERQAQQLAAQLAQVNKKLGRG